MLLDYLGLAYFVVVLQTLSCLTEGKFYKTIYYHQYIDKTICWTIPGLARQQVELCQKQPDTILAAMRGLQLAISECQHQFKSQRWNCSSLVTRAKYPYTSPLFKKGFRETSFAQAITAAGIAIAIAKGCSQGSLLNCGCDSRKYQGVMRESANWKWNGCSHNIDYGSRFSRAFLERREDAKDIHANVNHHNNRLGLMVIRDNMQIKCKCHGLSGSCEFKTCWRIVPDIRIVGNILNEKYRNAMLYSLNNKSTRRTRLKGRNQSLLIVAARKRKRSNNRKNKKMHNNMIYYQKSPSYCDPDNSLDFPGTTGRLCNRTSEGPDNCSSLCCGRGYNLLRRVHTELCKCEFQWCCEVECRNCTVDEWISVCK